jgi:hypothetical protein
MSIFCFGLSHQTATVNVRERFAIPESALPEALARLKTMPGLTEGLIVSTCNRTEFYVTGVFLDSPSPAFFENGGFFWNPLVPKYNSVSKIRCLLITFDRPITIAILAIFAMVLLSRAEAIFTCPLSRFVEAAYETEP